MAQTPLLHSQGRTTKVSDAAQKKTNILLLLLLLLGSTFLTPPSQGSVSIISVSELGVVQSHLHPLEIKNEKRIKFVTETFLGAIHLSKQLKAYLADFFISPIYINVINKKKPQVKIMIHQKRILTIKMSINNE